MKHIDLRILRVLLSCHGKVSPNSNVTHSSRTNYRYLTAFDKTEHLYGMRKVQRQTAAQMARLKIQLEEVIGKEGVQVEESLHND